MSLADRLRNARNAARLSQRGVARSLGIKGPSVAQWETGRTRPDIERLPDIARLYGLSLAELVNEGPTGEAASNEHEVIELFRSLSLEDQRAILTLIRTLTNKRAA